MLGNTIARDIDCNDQPYAFGVYTNSINGEVSRTGTARTANGDVTALLVRLDSNKIVWIDTADVSYNRADSVVMTNLNRTDLRLMADQPL